MSSLLPHFCRVLTCVERPGHISKRHRLKPCCTSDVDSNLENKHKYPTTFLIQMICRYPVAARQYEFKVAPSNKSSELSQTVEETSLIWNKFAETSAASCRSRQ